MINRQEVMDFSREFGLAPNVIEKDYVLGWILAGISNHSELSQSWIFKGGTCLKKCYFETYRFSEDLDFTLTHRDHLIEEFLIKTFSGVADWVYDESGIEILKETIRFKIYEDSQGGVSAEGRIGYRGPMQRRGDPARVKLDLTVNEVLVLEPVRREVHHPYPDKPEKGIQVLCYCFEEVFAEKVRALGERERPRDLYDVVHLYRHDNLRPDRTLVTETLKKKCEFKGIPVPTMQILESQPERLELEAEWENMLAHQLPALPPFRQFWDELPRVFGWLSGVEEKAVTEPIPVKVAVDTAWQPPSMAQAWHRVVPLEVIRFAASNRLCVDLTYEGTSRLIEPYSLRRTQDGNLLLHAVKHGSGEPRSYRVDRIQGANATNVPFVPRYTVELTPSGPIHAAPSSRGSKVEDPWSLKRPRTSRVGSGRKNFTYGPAYVIECPYCGKRFNRKTSSTQLNPHKDKKGYPCSGRTGYMVGMK